MNSWFRIASLVVVVGAGCSSKGLVPDGTTEPQDLHWTIETVGPTAKFSTTWLALDGTERAFISYSLGGTHGDGLQLARRDAAGWTREHLDDDFFTGDFSLVGVAPDHTPRVAYARRVSPATLEVRADTGTGAPAQTMSVFTPGMMSMAIDSAGRTHFGYVDDGFDTQGSGSAIAYAVLDDSQWRQESVIPPANSFALAFALDRDEQPAIVFSNTAELRYCPRGAEGWGMQTVDAVTSGQILTTNRALVFDSANHPHIVYEDQSIWRLKHAAFDGTRWQIETLPTDRDVIAGSVAIDAQDRLHVAYTYRDAGLGYAIRGGQGWALGTIDSAVTENPSLVVDATGQPHVSYTSAQQLKYAFVR